MTTSLTGRSQFWLWSPSFVHPCPDTHHGKQVVHFVLLRDLPLNSPSNTSLAFAGTKAGFFGSTGAGAVVLVLSVGLAEAGEPAATGADAGAFLDPAEAVAHGRVAAADDSPITAVRATNVSARPRDHTFPNRKRPESMPLDPTPALEKQLLADHHPE
ncbi:MAG: hypothetical protein ABSC41_01935 [Acidimicrobiales bacterium]